MVEQRQIFTKGINRRFPREEATDPHFFYTLQNARILTRGETGKIIRTPGYTKFNSSATTYSKTLDSIKFDDNYIVLYEDSVTTGTFHVEIFDNAGATVNSFSYSDDSVGTGDLLRSEGTVYIAPHNKVLYYDGSSWSLQDFKTEVPKITATSQATDAQGLASASIEPTGAPSGTVGSKARGSLTIVRNNVAYGETDNITVSVGSKTTDEITVTYTDSEEDIAQEIYDALRGEGGYSDPNITNDWDVSMSQTQDDVKLSGRDIYLVSKTTNTNRNNDAISVSSDFSITKRDQRGDRFQKLPTRENRFDPRDPTQSSGDGVTILTNNPSGASAASQSALGPLYVRLENIHHTVITENITTSDTAITVANKIETALTNDSKVSNDFTISKTGNEITLTAKEEGRRKNGNIVLKFRDPSFLNASEIFDVTKSDFTGGEEVDENFTLDIDTNYWYKVRYKYIDGTVSAASNPVKVNTGPSRATSLTISATANDLDGNDPKLQIFRRKEGGRFFLIKEEKVNSLPSPFVDNGDFQQDVFEEVDNVWTKLHKAQDIVENRYVRANITYPEEEYTNINLSVSAVTGSGETVPNNSKATLFVQPLYDDGSRGYFEEIGSVDVNSPDKQLKVDQASPLISNNDKSISELSFFANYRPHSAESIYSFNSIEIANENISLIEDSSRFPSRTRVFLGFRYIRMIDRGSNEDLSIRVSGWDTQGTDNEHYGFRVARENFSGNIDGEFPREIEVEIFGKKYTYLRIGANLGQAQPQAVYELADIEAIKRAAETGDLKIRLTDYNVKSLSSERPNADIVNNDFNIVGIIDTSEGYEKLSIQSEEDKILTPPPDCRIYLEIEDSPLDDIDNININNYWYKRNYKAFKSNDLAANKIAGIPEDENDTSVYTVGFELVNFKKNTNPSFNEYTGEGADKDGGRPVSGQHEITYYKYDWDYSIYELTNRTFIENDDRAIYIGKKDNDTSSKTFDITGFDYEEQDSLFLNTLRKDAIQQRLYFKSDLNLNKQEYKTQLIWSDELNLGSGFSGGRTFHNEAFFNISNENGDILDIKSLNNKLFVFCEEGVAQVNIGEVLTTQRSGEVYVDSSRFMTDYYWINDKLINVKKDSIKKYKNTIYFTDGYDVYAISGQGFNNVTNGVLDLDPSRDYYGAINPKYDEYQLCDYSNTETWVFNTVFQQWYGPFTYKYKSAVYDSLEFITIDDSLYEHDSGNTFGGTAFTTKIENAADDTEKSFYDKNFRKFYIGLSGDSNTTFKYGKDPNSLISVTASNIKEKNGYKHQGIQPNQNNTKSIYWTIESTNSGFELSDISWRFGVKRRR